MQSSDELAIRKLVADWLLATRDGDVDKVLALMEPDVVFLVPGQPPMKGRDTFAAGLRPLLQTHTIESLSDIEEVEISGDMAYIRTRLTIDVKPKDGASPHVRRSGYTLSVLRKQADGRWLLARDANLMAAEP